MDIVSAAKDILRKNRRVTGSHTYTVPSPDTYPYQWLWDSCFHIIVLARIEPDAARAEMRSLLAGQLPSGMMPHILYWIPGPLHHYEWGIDGVSALTQPPMLAFAAWEIYRRTADFAFLAEIYPALMRMYRYLINERDPHQHHLMGIINPDESGEDTSPRFDSMLKVPPDISIKDHLARRLELIDANRTCNFDASLCMSRHFWVKDVPFNTIMIKNLEILGRIARLVGDAQDARFCTANAELIKEAMRERLFEDGLFYSASALDGVYKLIKVCTWAMFAPLFAGLYTKDEAAALIPRLKDPDTFWAPWGVRTVSRAEPSYRAAPDGEVDVLDGGFWRGPVWMAPHWFIYRGLLDYGFTAEADELRSMSVRLVENAGFREYYNPETGEGLGARDFTWGALILDMIEA